MYRRGSNLPLHYGMLPVGQELTIQYSLVQFRNVSDSLQLERKDLLTLSSAQKKRNLTYETRLLWIKVIVENRKEYYILKTVLVERSTDLCVVPIRIYIYCCIHYKSMSGTNTGFHNGERSTMLLKKILKISLEKDILCWPFRTDS